MLFFKKAKTEQVKPVRKPISELKSKLKEKAEFLHNEKPKRKIDKREGRSLWDIESGIYDAKSWYRHHHIAYCQLWGTPREKIEKPAENNLPNESLIEGIMNEYVCPLQK